MRALLFRWMAVLLCLNLTAPAWAHPVPVSYVDFEVHEDAVSGHIPIATANMSRSTPATEFRDGSSFGAGAPVMIRPAFLTTRACGIGSKLMTQV